MTEPLVRAADPGGIADGSSRRADGADAARAEAGPHEALAHECATVAHRLMSALARQDAPAWLDLEITMAQLKALMAIVTRGPLVVGALGRALGISEPSASLLVDKLEEQGLAHRETDTEDRRRTLVVPTEAAADLFERLHQGRRERFVELVARLDDDELAALRLGMTALARAVGEEAAEARAAGAAREAAGPAEARS